MNKIMTYLAFISLMLVLAPSAGARTKLVALPERGDTIIRLDNPEVTLVEEQRVLALQKGINRVDFSWKGVGIDSDSIRIRMLSHPQSVDLLSVSYPPKEDALVWRIASPQAVEEEIRVSYLLSGIDRLVTYKATADEKETFVNLKSFLILRNFSGEDFDSALIRLDYGEGFERAIRHKETKQLLFLNKENVPIEKTFTFDAAKLPWDPEEIRGNVGIPVRYVVANSRSSGMGEHALWGGKARIFQEDGHGGTIFLGEDRLEFTPVDKEAELHIGNSRDIVVTQHKMKDKKINIRRNKDNRIILYDTDEVIRAEIENFRDRQVTIKMIEHIPGQWDMAEKTHPYEKEDAHTLRFNITIPAHGKETLVFNYHRRNVR